MTCAIHASGEVELYFYDELQGADRARVESHLTYCATCRQALDDLAIIDAALAAGPDVSSPPGGDWSAFMARLDAAIGETAPQAGVPWDPYESASIRVPSAPHESAPIRVSSDPPGSASIRVSSDPHESASIRVPSDPRRSAPIRVIGYLAMAALVALVTASVLLLVRQREPADVSAGTGIDLAPAAVTPPVPVRSDPALVSLSEAHFERSKLVVLGLATRDASDLESGSWARDRELAESLLNDTRLYRQAAEERGMGTLAGVMRDLELVLLQTSMSEEPDPASIEQLQRLIRRRDLLTKMDTVVTLAGL